MSKLMTIILLTTTKIQKSVLELMLLTLIPSKIVGKLKPLISRFLVKIYYSLEIPILDLKNTPTLQRCLVPKIGRPTLVPLGQLRESLPPSILMLKI